MRMPICMNRRYLWERYVEAKYRDRVPKVAYMDDDVPKIKAATLLNFAEQDPNINGHWPDYEAALKANGVKYQAYVYPKTYHGFHNDTTPRYDEAAAKLAWQRTIDHFDKTLKD
jgi:carboxymethylenebutenolidase